MLPMLLGLLGSGAASAGLLGTGILASPLVAGAIGSGIGSLAQTGSLEDGIKTGMLSFLGGQAGSLIGGAGGAASAAGAATGGAASKAAQAASMNLAPLAATSATGLPTGAAAAALAPKGAGLGAGLGGLRSAFSAGREFMRTPAGIGLGLGATLAGGMSEPPGSRERREGEGDIPENRPAPRTVSIPGPGYRPGVSPEFNYGTSYPQPYGSLRRFANGGIAALAAPAAAAGGEKNLIVEAVRAVKGLSPSPEVALGRFVAAYGEEALRDLVQRTRAGEMDAVVERDGGAIRGPGDGMEDRVPASIDQREDVLLSDGEFVIPADVVSGLGNGSTDAGARVLERMNERVRQARTGTTKQPGRVPPGAVVPA